MGESGSFSVFSFRMRYTMLLKNQTDPTIADFFYEKWLQAWAGDAPSYNYWFVTSFAMGCMVAILTRHWFFNPDLHGRKQEQRKHMPDRHRQWAFSLPYFNHRLRNMSAKYRWCMIDNEPDGRIITPPAIARIAARSIAGLGCGASRCRAIHAKTRCSHRSHM